MTEAVRSDREREQLKRLGTWAVVIGLCLAALGCLPGPIYRAVTHVSPEAIPGWCVLVALLGLVVGGSNVTFGVLVRLWADLDRRWGVRLTMAGVIGLALGSGPVGVHMVLAALDLKFGVEHNPMPWAILFGLTVVPSLLTIGIGTFPRAPRG